MSDMDALLKKLADHDARVAAPPALEAAVMRAWRARNRSGGTAARQAASPVCRRQWRWLLPAAAAIPLVLAGDLAWRGEPPAPAFAPSELRRGEPSALVRVRMSRSALVPLGIQLADPDAAGLVDVDVVVGEDGIAQSIHRITLVNSIQEPQP